MRNQRICHFNRIKVQYFFMITTTTCAGEGSAGADDGSAGPRARKGGPVRHFQVWHTAYNHFGAHRKPLSILTMLTDGQCDQLLKSLSFHDFKHCKP
jgi:hypothetical protein